jgi:hypothetical protein
MPLFLYEHNQCRSDVGKNTDNLLTIAVWMKMQVLRQILLTDVSTSWLVLQVFCTESCTLLQFFDAIFENV